MSGGKFLRFLMVSDLKGLWVSFIGISLYDGGGLYVLGTLGFFSTF